jgi:hypothetical protein
MMRIAVILIAGFGLSGNTQAEPLTLLCSGSLTLDGKQSNIDRETAILDIESQTFKPPLYPAFQVTEISETNLSFGSELPLRQGDRVIADSQQDRPR